ncbi:IS110 family transposase [Brucella tritici]|uniref:IS110 family transposase n=1 Tax=Brucella tritici TaxID=94626 RepID=A0A6N6Q684_9HYPH|nr:MULTISPECIES: IS110 family transposase [Brucella]MCH4538710.1 IS110 family transposase [Ochrobactrum sp. A-1]KAB2666928.1 IS110 family transposase [Brucella tritici]KAB2667150.1 IS110 family transposase [Brucella tritici]KAB2773928.1 IS110 family transposase [Brucella anthropi]NKW09534.1 IS110 family transposase [Brucella tritici]
MTALYDYHIGVDYHKAYSHLVVQDSAGKTLRSGRVKNDRQSLASFLERYRDNSHAVVEATRNWMVIYDWLDDICDDVVLAHPLKVKAIADAKIKTDKIDATVLAHLLRADLVPEAYAPSDRARELRLALRERMFYVRLRTMVKNRIVTAFDRYPEQTAQLKKLGDLFGKVGRQQLATLDVSEIDRVQIDRSLAFIGDINERIKQAETTIRAMTKTNANVKLLKTIPGIGEFFARLIDAEIDDIGRFRNPKKLAAYAGLVPSTYSSGGKTYHGRIIKQGNKWLRWAFVEAVQPAVATDPHLRAQYEHLKLRGTNKARVAIARKLLTIAFQILRDQRPYERRDANAEEGASSTISRLS